MLSLVFEPTVEMCLEYAERYCQEGLYETAADYYFQAFSLEPSSEGAPRYLIKAFILYSQSGAREKAEDVLKRLKNYYEGFYPAWFSEAIRKDFYTLNPDLLPSE